MRTKQLHLNGSTLLILQDELTTVTAEFSHRGEVKKIFEFPIHKSDQEKVLQESVYADKYGDFYRIKHVRVKDNHFDHGYVRVE